MASACTFKAQDRLLFLIGGSKGWPDQFSISKFTLILPSSMPTNIRPIVYKLVHLNIGWLTSVRVDEMIGFIKMSNITSSKLRRVES